MSNKQSLRNGLILVAILVATSLLAVLWPTITGMLGRAGGGSASSPAEMTTVTLPELTLPMVGAVGGTEVNAFVGLGMLAGGIIALVLGTGVVIGLLFSLISRIIDSTVNSPSFQEASRALETRYKEELKAINTERQTATPRSSMPRWSVVSNTLISAFFLSIFSMILYASITGSEITGDGFFSSPIVGAAVVVAILGMVWRVRVRGMALAEGNETDNSGIPWDFIAVLITGLLVVGAGIGLILYFNPPM
ncbi:MAG: hypothetical protein Kow0080_19850 [Candidatus Promineifilaceae bacterium]